MNSMQTLSIKNGRISNGILQVERLAACPLNICYSCFIQWYSSRNVSRISKQKEQKNIGNRIATTILHWIDTSRLVK